VERLVAGAHCGSLILDSISSDSMLIELGGSDVYLEHRTSSLKTGHASNADGVQMFWTPCYVTWINATC
jgi:hypothetical protein